MAYQHPGKVLLQQYLKPQNISQNRLARAIHVPPRRINEIVHEKRGISADTAVRLAIFFGGEATYWTQLQAEYEIDKVRQNINIQLSATQTPLHTKSLKTRTIKTRQAGTNNSESKNTKNIKKRIMR